MSERFKQAAKVLLSRRLRNLLRIDETVEIDRKFITCAEYQLFIDEMRADGKNCQPDHWKTERFPPGDAKKPILGVRGSDGEEFCKWLRKKDSAPGVKYRLPTLAEAEEHPVIDKQVGCWCKDGNKLVIAGINSPQWQTWQQKLSEVLILNSYLIDFNLDLYGDLNRVLTLNRNLNPDFYNDFNRVLNPYLNFDLYRFLHLDLYGDLYDDLNRALNDDLNRDLNRNLNHNCNLNRVLNRNLNRVLNPELNPEFNRNFYHFLHLDLNRDLYRDLYQKIEADEVSDLFLLCFPLLFVIVIYHLLSEIYNQVSKNQQALNSLGLEIPRCKAISVKYADRRDEVFPLYAYLVLIDERQQGRMPAWEGIRIVRERVE